jgi:hypothetical protein
MDHLIIEYRQVLKSIDTNVRSLSKLSPRYITTLIQRDADDISKLLQIDDSTLLYMEVQLFKEKISEFETVAIASKFIQGIRNLC